MLKKDKQKVLGEVFDDDRVREFLQVQQREGVSTDYDMLEKAYRGMRAENFATFVKFFVDAGRDLQATNPKGMTFLEVISAHRHAGDYAQAIRKHS